MNRRARLDLSAGQATHDKQAPSFGDPAGDDTVEPPRASDNSASDHTVAPPPARGNPASADTAATPQARGLPPERRSWPIIAAVAGVAIASIGLYLLTRRR